LTSLKKTIFPNGSTEIAVYDAAGRMIQQIDRSSQATGIGYDALGRVTSQTNVLGQVTYSAHDAAGQMSVPLANYDYALTAAGRRSSVTELNGRNVQYAYDSIYRLTNETITVGATVKGVGYTFDPVGNRLSRESSVPGVSTESHAFDANDRLTSDTYDANGNTLLGTVADPISGTLSQVTEHYDFEDRLISHNNGQVQIVYDGDGNRARKTVAGITTYFLVDDLNPTGYAQVLEELTSPSPADGSLTPVVTRVYTYGLQRISEDQLIENEWKSSFYGYDGSGSVRNLTDLAGQITDTYELRRLWESDRANGNEPEQLSLSRRIVRRRPEAEVAGEFDVCLRWGAFTARMPTGDTLGGTPDPPP
jgi:YD repeat-containing protein